MGNNWHVSTASHGSAPRNERNCFTNHFSTSNLGTMKEQTDPRVHRDLSDQGYTQSTSNPGTYERQLENGRWETRKVDGRHSQGNGEQGHTTHY